MTVARVVRPERQDAFEEWAADVQRRVASFPGHLGSTLLRPGPAGDEFHLVYRFRDDESLGAWERSDERRDALVRVNPSAFAAAILAARVARETGFAGLRPASTPWPEHPSQHSAWPRGAVLGD